ncbi:hypothetical protein nbrc107696_27020 [Gordonia spumicola]|uniref:Uncharacterized protein n=1 Tax=Gordonia spumicola TaxID=589161 RepID=A0A7I9VA36_9ACTN|nr:hypothetical protein [Gordonia spumicola]GEE02256.1 hypothetical protein nbrc107696_27020 [Gordonia spumicola]
MTNTNLDRLIADAEARVAALKAKQEKARERKAKPVGLALIDHLDGPLDAFLDAAADFHAEHHVTTARRAKAAAKRAEAKAAKDAAEVSTATSSNPFGGRHDDH